MCDHEKGIQGRVKAAAGNKPSQPHQSRENGILFTLTLHVVDTFGQTHFHQRRQSAGSERELKAEAEPLERRGDQSQGQCGRFKANRGFSTQGGSTK